MVLGGGRFLRSEVPLYCWRERGVSAGCIWASESSARLLIEPGMLQEIALDGRAWYGRFESGTVENGTRVWQSLRLTGFWTDQE